MVLIKSTPTLCLIPYLLVALITQLDARPSLSESIIAPQPEAAAPPQSDDAAADDASEDASGGDASEEEEDESSGEEPEVAAGQCCPSGWKQFKSHCYRGFTEPPLPFFSVKQQCHKYGAHFVSIHSSEEYAFVKSEWDLNKYWIGVVSYEDGHHENQDGTANDFQAFDDPIWEASEEHPYICEINHCASSI